MLGKINKILLSAVVWHHEELVKKFPLDENLINSS